VYSLVYPSRKWIAQLAIKSGRNKNWIRTRIANISAYQLHNTTPSLSLLFLLLIQHSSGEASGHVLCDHLAWRRTSVHRKYSTKSIEVYRQGRDTLEKEGYTIQAVLSLMEDQEYGSFLVMSPHRCVTSIRSHENLRAFIAYEAEKHSLPLTSRPVQEKLSFEI